MTFLTWFSSGRMLIQVFYWFLLSQLSMWSWKMPYVYEMRWDDILYVSIFLSIKYLYLFSFNSIYLNSSILITILFVIFKKCKLIFFQLIMSEEWFCYFLRDSYIILLSTIIYLHDLLYCKLTLTDSYPN